MSFTIMTLIIIKGLSDFELFAVSLSMLYENTSTLVNETCSKEDKMGMKASQIQRETF